MWTDTAWWTIHRADSATSWTWQPGFICACRWHFRQRLRSCHHLQQYVIDCLFSWFCRVFIV